MTTVIESTRVSPWVRRRVIYEFSGFPRCIATIIAEYLVTLKLLEWIDKAKIDMKIVGGTPGSIEAGLTRVGYLSRWSVCNPEMAEYVKENIQWIENYDFMWGNPALFDWLMERCPRDVDMYEFDTNTNPNALKYLLDNGISVISTMTRSNPAAFEYYLKTMTADEVSKLYENTAATDYLGDLTGHGRELSTNSHPRAIEYLRTHQHEIDWSRFSTNPGIFEYRADPELINSLSE